MSGRAARVSICGEVSRRLTLPRPELARLADAELVADLRCHEGWTRPDLRWRGVRLGTLLAMAGARREGRFVTVASGGYAVVLTREEAERDGVLIAVERAGGPPGAADGAPRLVGPSDWDCFRTVKAVDRIEVTREPQEATAERIALARLGR